jgi:hypothetical protein
MGMCHKLTELPFMNAISFIAENTCGTESGFGVKTVF